jgi:hypothetical protein
MLAIQENATEDTNCDGADRELDGPHQEPPPGRRKYSRRPRRICGSQLSTCPAKGWEFETNRRHKAGFSKEDPEGTDPGRGGDRGIQGRQAGRAEWLNRRSQKSHETKRDQQTRRGSETTAPLEAGDGRDEQGHEYDRDVDRGLVVGPEN